MGFLPSKRACPSSVLPTECAEDEVHDKEGAEEDEGAEVDPRPGRPAGVLHLTTGQKAQGRKTKQKTNKKEKRKKEPGAQKKARRAGVDEEVEVGSGTHPVQDLSPALQCYTLQRFFRLNFPVAV